MHDTTINESIKVWACFDKGIFPIAMSWNKRLIKFEKLIFASSKMIGKIRLVNLVCSSETSNFELEYNTDDYSWRIKKVMDKE